VATTVETVRFDRPETVDFRLTRGLVPHVVKRVTLHDQGGTTEVEYTDVRAPGRWPTRSPANGKRPSKHHFDRIGTEAERRATHPR
jgi:hypothetical protein